MTDPNQPHGAVPPVPPVPAPDSAAFPAPPVPQADQAMPGYGAPTGEAPAYGAPAPDASGYAAPGVPAYAAPGSAPDAPAYGAPPAAPAYGAPGSAPEATGYGTPADVPAHGAPGSAPEAPTYGAPTAPAYGAPAYGAPAAPPYQAPPGAYPVPVGGYPAAVGGYAPEAPVKGSPLLGVISLVAGLIALVVVPILGAVFGFQIGNKAPGFFLSSSSGMSSDLGLLAPARMDVLMAELTFWAGTAIGIAAIVLGIIAIVKRRGRGQGLAGMILAVVGPVAFFFFTFIACGVGAGAATGGY